MKNKRIRALTFVVILLTSAISLASECRSKDYCIKTAPLYIQNHKGLATHISKREKTFIARDPGWCGNTSVGMILKGLTLDKPKNFNYGSDVMNNISVLSDSEDDSFELIYYAGKLIKTDLLKGGTTSNNVSSLFQHIYDNYPKNPSDKFLVAGYKEQIGHYLLQLREDIRMHLPLYYVSFTRHQNNKVIGAHALVMTGFDDKFYRIQDPWGREYNVHYSNIGNGSVEVLLAKDLNSDGGYVGKYAENHLILLTSIVGIALNGVQNFRNAPTWNL